MVAADPEAIVRLEDVRKTYVMGSQQVHALAGVTVTIVRGVFCAVMGASGSGKSTLLNLVGCLDRPTSGRYFLAGQDVSTLNDDRLSEFRLRYLGFIFQSFNLIPNLTAKENVMLPMLFQDVDIDVREAKAEELLTKVGLAERMEHYPNELSGGEQQRVAIARSLANDPQVILADEPTGNLDTKTGEIIISFLEKLNKEGKTVIMVTHDPHLAEKHAQIIYHIRDGKIEKITQKVKGKWKEVSEKER